MIAAAATLPTPIAEMAGRGSLAPAASSIRKRLILAMKAQHQSQADGHFRGGHGENHEEHDLSVGLSPACSGDDERQASGVEHDLHAHQRVHDVAAHEKAREADGKECDGQQQSVFEGNGGHQGSPAGRGSGSRRPR
jgi:hypothetical protein